MKRNLYLLVEIEIVKMSGRERNGSGYFGADFAVSEIDRIGDEASWWMKRISHETGIDCENYYVNVLSFLILYES